MYNLSKFSIIVAIGENNGIGKNGKIPWKNKDDMTNFKNITIGKGNNAVIMGRKTYESIPKGKRPLKNRKNIIISSKEIEGVENVNSLKNALYKASKYNKTYIIGGEKVYEEAIEKWNYLCEKIIVSHIPKKSIITKEYDKYFQYEKAKNIGLYIKTKIRIKNDLIIETIRLKNSDDLIHPEKKYLNLLKRILLEGEDRNDRTNIGTKSLFGCNLNFDLRKGFPLITTKKTWFKGIVKELLFFISGKTDTKILESENVNIWKDNTSLDYLTKYNLKWVEGDMGPGYGFQWRHHGAEYNGCNINYKEKGIDQINNLINGLKNNPFGRRHIINSWDVSNINLMALPPCHCFVQFYVGCVFRSTI